MFVEKDLNILFQDGGLFSQDADEMGWWDVIDHSASGEHDFYQIKGALHTQKFSGSVTLESTSPCPTIVKSNHIYSSETKNRGHFSHVLTLLYNNGINASMWDLCDLISLRWYFYICSQGSRRIPFMPLFCTVGGSWDALSTVRYI